MPGKDGTGPTGSGPRAGGRGSGAGSGRGLGMGGECICSKCGTSIPHKPGTPCSRIQCPNCGSYMNRK